MLLIFCVFLTAAKHWKKVLAVLAAAAMTAICVGVITVVGAVHGDVEAPAPVTEPNTTQPR
ncbi:hypothetical protein [Kribbella kalugense]|nr:hypothetical protein [Kribbella kalugense]